MAETDSIRFHLKASAFRELANDPGLQKLPAFREFGIQVEKFFRMAAAFDEKFLLQPAELQSLKAWRKRRGLHIHSLVQQAKRLDDATKLLLRETVSGLPGYSRKEADHIIKTRFAELDKKASREYSLG
jgi:hypothetical protein